VHKLGVVVAVCDLQGEVVGGVEARDPHLEVDRELLIAHGVGFCVRVVLAGAGGLAVPGPLVDARAGVDVVLLHRVRVMPVD